ncbi:anti-sigma factor family protein [Xanthobacteraceae bacterium A53D]
MNQPVDPITEADLQAYVEDQLEVARRIEVETHLCENPAEAMRVIHDLRIRDELRLALAGAPRIARISTTDAARRLERGISRDRFFRRFQRAAAVALLVGAGWFAHAQMGPAFVGDVVASTIPPAYVADAFRAHNTSALRATMRSQIEAKDYDRGEILSATAITMPDLPENWTVADVQIFPSTFGPSVEMTIRTEKLGTLSLFATRPGGFDVVPATLVHEQSLAAAYWQVGEVAYALVSNAKASDLDRAADRLARSLY